MTWRHQRNVGFRPHLPWQLLPLMAQSFVSSPMIRDLRQASASKHGTITCIVRYSFDDGAPKRNSLLSSGIEVVCH